MPVTGFCVIELTDVTGPPLSEKSTWSIPVMWNATTPTGSLPVNVWYGTTSQRAIALASEPAPVPIAAGCAVAPEKPVPGTRSAMVPDGAGAGAGAGSGVGAGAGAGS